MKTLIALLALSVCAFAQQIPADNTPLSVVTYSQVPTGSCTNYSVEYHNPLTGNMYRCINATPSISRVGTWTQVNTGGGGGGAVSSVFTRTGAVTAQVGDYSAFYLAGATLNGVTVPVASGIAGFQLPNIANTGLGVNNVLSGTGNSQVNTLEVNLNPDTSLTNGATIPATDCGGALLSSSTQTWNLPQANLGGNFVTGRTLTFINTGGTLTITPSTSSIGPGAGGASYAISPGTTAAPHTVTLMSQGGNYAIVYDSLQPERAIGTIFGDGTAVLSSGLTNYYVVPFACAKGIDGWNMTVTPSGGTAAVDVWKIATGTAVPTVSNTITGSVVPTLSTGTAISSTTLTGWTKTVAAKDIFGFHVNSVAGSATQISITLGCQ